MQARTLHGAFLMGTSLLIALLGILAGRQDSATSFPRQESSSVRYSLGQRFRGELLHPLCVLYISLIAQRGPGSQSFERNLFIETCGPA